MVPISTESDLEKMHARDIVTTGLKAVPEVGSVLSGALSFLWKDPKADRLFDELVAYVNDLVPESITKERIGQQNYQVEGLKKALDEYQREGSLAEKGRMLGRLKDKFIELEPAYLNNPDTPPEKVLPLVIAYGRLRLAVLRERLLHQKEYYPDNVSTLLVPDYNDAVDALTKVAKTIKQKIIDNRLAKIKVIHDDNPRLIRWRAPTPRYILSDGFCDWNAGRHYYTADDAKAGKAGVVDGLDRRRDVVRKIYEKDLDALLQPITQWPSLTPVAQEANADGHPIEDSHDISDILQDWINEPASEAIKAK